jgi:hypothetical protein
MRAVNNGVGLAIRNLKYPESVDVLHALRISHAAPKSPREIRLRAESGQVGGRWLVAPTLPGGVGRGFHGDEEDVARGRVDADCAEGVGGLVVLASYLEE